VADPGKPRESANATSPLPVAKSKTDAGAVFCTEFTSCLRHHRSIPPLSKRFAMSYFAAMRANIELTAAGSGMGRFERAG
jgi:hypothetical protein